jgi:GNAT superfamily N-acetyltransferase
MQANLFIGVPPEPALTAARTIYAAAFGQPPYNEGSEQADAFVTRVRRYAAERDGLRLVLVDEAAVALAVLARPGDWWRDRAAEAVGPAQTARWIGDLCLEVVHLAVRPDRQGRGLGRLTHDLLLAGSPAPTALLTCSPQAKPAYNLYRSRGWTTFNEAKINDSYLMARDL